MSAFKANMNDFFLVMGPTGSGKSTFVNLVSGSTQAVERRLHSCTSTVRAAQSFQLSDHSINLVDTPAFDDATFSEADVLKKISDHLASTYRSGQKLNGIIYMHRISDCRLSGPSRRIFKLFQRLCGEEAFGNVVIVTNMWDKVPPEVGAEREAELETDQYLFKSILEKGGKMFRHNNTVPSAHMILLHLASKSPVVLRIQKELVDQSRSLAQTAVGVELNRQMSDALDSRAGIFANNPAMLIREKAEALKQTMEVIEALEAEKAARVEAEKELGRLREEAEKTKDAGTQNIVHKSVWCDGCETKPIFGVRHKCLQCKDYDLCTTCLCSPKLRASHDPKHAFFPVDTPKDLTAYQAEKLKLEAGNPTHLGFQCDACQVRPIVGARNRCMNCRDFNLCQTCVSSRQIRLQHDKDHVFFPMDDPQKREPNVPVTSFGMRPAA